MWPGWLMGARVAGVGTAAFGSVRAGHARPLPGGEKGRVSGRGKVRRRGQDPSLRMEDSMAAAVRWRAGHARPLPGDAKGKLSGRGKVLRRGQWRQGSKAAHHTIKSRQKRTLYRYSVLFVIQQFEDGKNYLDFSSSRRSSMSQTPSMYCTPRARSYLP